MINISEVGALVWKSGGTRWGSWLRHCPTSQKVSGSISDGFTGIFHWHYPPSGHTTALGSTHPVTEMSTRGIFCGDKDGGGVHKADNFTNFMCWLSWNLGASTSSGLVQPCNGIALPFTIICVKKHWDIFKIDLDFVYWRWKWRTQNTGPLNFFSDRHL